MQGHQYETVSGFVCKAFGYIPRTGETIKVIIERANQEDHGDYDGSESDHEDDKEKTQIFKLEILAGNARKVSAVRFERINNDEASVGTKEIPRFMPKIRRRKSSSDDESDSSAEGDEVPDHMANDYVTSVHGDNTSDQEGEREEEEEVECDTYISKYGLIA
ncbi:hypothetical protein ACS0TY_035322 [Phlomoides rotata]